MPQPSQCPKCGGSMAEGHVMGRTSSSIPALGSWVEGKPERSIWTGLKYKGKSRMDLAAFRCTRCGFVETYATTDSAIREKADERSLVLVFAAIAAVALATIAVIVLRT